jgi:hypothetical protein
VIRLDGEVLWFDTASGVTPLPIGTEVLVTIGTRIYCETFGDVHFCSHVQAERVAEEAAAQTNRLNHLREQADAFNQQIKLPVAWHSGIKMVRSGLSERSNGDGRNRRTVVHIILKRDIARGNLKRKAGDFLCASSRGSLGNHFDGSPEVRRDGEGRTYRAKVTCATCIRRAEFLMGRRINDGHSKKTD